MIEVQKIEEWEEFKDFLNKVNDLAEKNMLLFRGQANHEWDIENSYFREIKKQIDKEASEGTWVVDYKKILNKKIIKNYFHLFSEKMEKKLNQKIYSILNIMAEIRHSGNHMPFIDFTSRIYNALWFACIDIKNIDNDFKLYLIKTNSSAIRYNLIMDDLDKQDSDHGYLKFIYKSPVKIVRSISQNSFFIFGNPSEIKRNFDIEEYVFSKELKKDIIYYLKNLNIDVFSIFPDANGLYRDFFEYDINFTYTSEVLESMGMYKSSIKILEKYQKINKNSSFIISKLHWLRFLAQEIDANHTIQNLKQLEDIKDKFWGYFYMGKIFLEMNKYNLSLENLKKSLELWNENKIDVSKKDIQQLIKHCEEKNAKKELKIENVKQITSSLTMAEIIEKKDIEPWVTIFKKIKNDIKSEDDDDVLKHILHYSLKGRLDSDRVNSWVEKNDINFYQKDFKTRNRIKNEFEDKLKDKFEEFLKPTIQIDEEKK